MDMITESQRNIVNELACIVENTLKSSGFSAMDVSGEQKLVFLKEIMEKQFETYKEVLQMESDATFQFIQEKNLHEKEMTLIEVDAKFKIIELTNQQEKDLKLIEAEKMNPDSSNIGKLLPSVIFGGVLMAFTGIPVLV